MHRKPLTLEYLAFALILMLSIGLRFINLGTTPLNSDEAVLALQSFNLAAGNDVLISGNPGYIALTTVLFSLLRPSTIFARFWPALIGSLVVLLPLLFKDVVGKKATLILAIFLAIDPVLISQSRVAGGSMFALVGLLAGLGLLLKRKPVLSGLAFALALLGGVHLWTGLIGLGLTILVLKKWIPGSIGSGVFDQWERQDTWRLVGTSLGSVIIASTVFFILPRGISAIGSGVVEYIASWGKSNDIPLNAVLISWALTYFPVMVMGVWGIFAASKEKRSVHLFIFYLLIISFVIAVLNPFLDISNLAWLSLPLWALNAMMLQKFIDSLGTEKKLVWLSMTVLLIVMFGFSFTNFGNLVYANPITPEILQGRLVGIFLPFILLILVSILVSWGWSASATRQGILTGVLLIFLMSIPGSTWRAAGFGNQLQNELWNGSNYPIGDGNLSVTLTELGRWKSGYAHRLDITVMGLDIPSLTWSLRDFEEVRYQRSVDNLSQHSVILTSSEEELQAVSVYRGQKLTWSTRPDFVNMGFREWVKWRLFRHAPAARNEILLWVRNDLFPGASIE